MTKSRDSFCLLHEVERAGKLSSYTSCDKSEGGFEPGKKSSDLATRQSLPTVKSLIARKIRGLAKHDSYKYDN